MAFPREWSNNQLVLESELLSLRGNNDLEDRASTRLNLAFQFCRHHKYRQDTGTDEPLSREDSSSLPHNLLLFQDCLLNTRFRHRM